MKALKLFTSLTLALAIAATASAQTAPNKMVIVDPHNPDAFFQTIFSEKAQGLLFSELRKVLIREADFDPLNHRLPDAIDIDTKLAIQMEPMIRNVIEGAIGTRLNAGELKVRIEGLHYESQKSGVQLQGAEVRGQAIDTTLQLRIRETVVQADRILIRIKPGKPKAIRMRGADGKVTWIQPLGGSSFLNDFFLEMKGASFRAKNLSSLSADLGVSVESQSDGSIRVGFKQGLLKVFDGLTADELKNELVFSPGTIRIPEGFGLQIGDVVMRVDPKKIEAALQQRKAALAKLIMAPIADEVKGLPAKLLKGQDLGFTIPAQFNIDVPCLGKTGIRISRFGVVGGDQILIGLSVLNASLPPSTDVSTFNDQFSQAADATFSKIARDKSSVSIGVGQHLISWALETSLRGCMKDKVPASLGLGPAGVETHMDEANSAGIGSIALHAQTKLKWLIGLVVGKRMLEFPVKVNPRLTFRAGSDLSKEIEMRKALSLTPFAKVSPDTLRALFGVEQTKLILDLSGPDVTDQVLKGGYGEIPSNLNHVRLKKIVMKTVRSQLNDGLAKAQIEVPLPFAEGDDLSYANVGSDGFGNLVLDLRLDPTIAPDAANFWELLAKNVGPFFKPGENQAK